MNQRLLGAHLSIAGGVDKALDRAAELKVTALQIFTKNQVQWKVTPLKCEEVELFQAKLADGTVAYLCAHASYLINLAAPDETIRRKSVAALITEVQRADMLGCHCVVLHPGSPKDDGLDVGIERIAKGLAEVLQQTADCRTAVALENTAGQGASIGADMAELEAVLAAVSWHNRVRVCLDTCHAFAAGHDLSHGEGVRAFAEVCDRTFGLERVELLHLNDSKAALGKRVDRHTHIGEGQIGRAGFRAILCEPLLAAFPAVIETPKEADGMAADRKNLDILKQLAAECCS